MTFRTTGPKMGTLVRTSPTITRASTFLLRVGVLARLLAFRRQVHEQVDAGMVELWANQLGIDEEGCVCSDPDCFFRRYHNGEA